MSPYLLISLLLAPTWTGPAAKPPTPARGVATTTAFAADFAPPKGAAGLTLPQRGAGVVTADGQSVLRLAPSGSEGVSVWLPVPVTARGKVARLRGRMRSEGGSVEALVGAVNGTRPPTLAESWARWPLAAGSDWSEFTLHFRLPHATDSLALGLRAGQAAVRLDALALEVDTREREQRLTQLAARSGNLVLNSGFEAGTTGYRAVMTADTLAAGDPPVPIALRVSDREAEEGRRSAAVAVRGGTVVITAPAVVLKPEQVYTFALSTRRQGAGLGRLGLGLRGPDGRLVGYAELALPAEWKRLSTRFTAPGEPARPYVPEIRFLPDQLDYYAQLDSLTLRAGESPDYLTADGPTVTIADGLPTAAGFGHVAQAGATVTVAAAVAAGAFPLEAVLSGELESCLGTVVTPLPERSVALQAEVTANTELWRGSLSPGWYRFRVRVISGGAVAAEAEQAIACVTSPAGAWSLAARWTTPDLYLSPPQVQAWLKVAESFGLEARWLEHNAVALWRGLEPRRGEFHVKPLAATLAAGKQAGLADLLVVDPRPPADEVPEWLDRKPDGGRVALSPAEWSARLTGLRAALGTAPVTWVVRGDEAELAGARAALGDAAVASAADWHELAPAPCGAFDAGWVSVGDAVVEPEPFSAAARRAQELLTAVAAGHRRFLWPNQGLQPLPYGDGVRAALSTTDGGPAPFVAVWSTLRRVVGDRPVAASRLDGPVCQVQFGGEPAALALWTATGSRTAALPFAPKVVLATGESAGLKHDGNTWLLPLSEWPLYLLDLTAAQTGQVTEALERAGS